MNPRIGNKKLGQVTPLMIQTLYSDLRVAGLSSRSIIHTHTLLHKSFQQAVKWRMIAQNPVALVEPPRAERREMSVLTRQEASKFLDATRGHRYAALFTLAVSTGMRQGELLGLRWSDVDIDAKRLQVQQALQRQREEGLVFVTPKTRQSRRTIVLSDRAVVALKSHLARQDDRRATAGCRWVEHDLVFAGLTGGPLEPSKITLEFKRTLAAAGLPAIRFHDLRHTAATLLLSQNLHPKMVSEMLGHSTISITLDTYSHLVPVLHQQAAVAMDAMLGD